MRKKIVALLRVSSDGQDLQSQRSSIEQYAKVNKIVIDEWIEEQGVSGYKNKFEDREAIQKIEQMALNQELESLIVFNLDRIGRSLEGNLFMATMSEYDVKVISTTEGLLNSDDMNSELLTSIKFAIAKLESKKTSVRVKAGKNITNQMGLHAGGRPPFGYKIVNQKLVVVEEEAEIVRLIFDSYIKNGTNKTVRLLKEKNITKRGNRFSQAMILDIIHDSVYIGHRRYNYYQRRTNNPTDKSWYRNHDNVKYQPFNKDIVILDESIFKQAQKLVKERTCAAGKTTMGNRTDVLLEGLVYHVCQDDGQVRKLHIDTKKDKYGNAIKSFRCSHCKRNMVKGRKCYGVKTITPLVEKAILEELRNLSIDELEEKAKLTYDLKRKSLENSISELKDKLRKKELALKNANAELEKAFMGESSLSLTVINDLIIKLQNEVINEKDLVVKSKMELESFRDMDKDLVFMFSNYKNFKYLYTNASEVEKKQLLREVVESITIDDSKINIKLYLYDKFETI